MSPQALATQDQTFAARVLQISPPAGAPELSTVQPAMDRYFFRTIAALENGGHAFSSFAAIDTATAISMSGSKYDGIVFEGEHSAWDIQGLRDSLQYMLNRKQIAASGSITPGVTPIVRVPVNGV